MTDPIRYLFVYGTLMSGATSAFGRAQRLRLAAESDSLGPASIPHARLFDLGRYPGATIDGTLDDIVQGEAVLLNNPRSALKWLDAYEGVTSGKEETNEYARVVREARLAGGESIDVWVYVLRKAPDCGLIASGRWINHDK